ncbi:TRIC cation channel family protein [Zwartia sp.]|uniref:trimeric intracellular cation channel family protein n=1 Tax=Zwartia sp. TaxID=2978004 RepID=UPI0027168B43|nr:TRIC cation channel family protein [Zwartia sp.]MDO9023981.1 TRIC cation channel family protein [Zwartia sp.]
MVETMPTLPLWVDVFAMATTAVYGAATARSRNVPISGTLFAGILGGAAGGIVRDLLLGLEPVAITGPYYFPWILFASILGAIFFYKFISMKIPYLVLRGIAIGLLISIGCQKALIHGVPFISIILCGVLTATVGGMALDALTRHRSAVFSQAHWFATALILGSLVFYGLTITTNFYIATFGATLTSAALYVTSVLRNWPSPKWPNEDSDMSA